MEKPKEKAIALKEIFHLIMPSQISLTTKKNLVIKCAIKTVEEIISSSPSLPIQGNGGYFTEDIELSTQYWKEVKQELEKTKK